MVYTVQYTTLSLGHWKFAILIIPKQSEGFIKTANFQ